MNPLNALSDQVTDGGLRRLDAIAIPVTLTALCLNLPASTFEDLLARALGLSLAALLGLVFLQRPHYGFYLLSVIGALIPLSVERRFPEGVSPTLLVAALTIVGWLSFVVSRPAGSRCYMSPPARPAILLMLGALVSLAFGQYPWFPVPAAPLRAQLGALGLFLFSGGAFLAAQDLLRLRRSLRHLTRIFLLAAAARLLLLLPPLQEMLPLDALASGTIGSVFWVWLVSVALSQALQNSELSAGWRLMLLLLLAGVAYFTFFEWREWASGWLPAAVAAITVLALARPRLTLMLATVMIPFGVWSFDSMWSAVWSGEQAYSYVTRVEALRTLANLGAASPLFGLGPANYYHYTPVFPLLGWYVHFSSHNNYVDIFLQTGALGLFAFLWFAASMGRVTLALQKRLTDGFDRAYMLGAAGGLAGTLTAAALGDWVIPFAYNVGVRGFAVSILAWIFLGGAAAIASDHTESPH